MKKIELDKNEIVEKYKELKSSYKVASFFNTSATAVKRILKDSGVLRTQNLAAKERESNNFRYIRTDEHRKKLSENASKRTGVNSPRFGKKHSEDVKKRLSEMAKSRVGELNPNYKNGSYFRRPRDFKISEFTKIRNFVFNRDKYTCKLSNACGGHLHAHHLIPFWVCEDAFLDPENIITVSTKIHFELCHKGSWGSFNVDIIPDSLIEKYSLSRERLSELASLYMKKMR